MARYVWKYSGFKVRKQSKYFFEIVKLIIFYSLGEREKTLMESNGLLFYGTERLLSYYQATKIPTFNLNSIFIVFFIKKQKKNFKFEFLEMNLMFINDLSQTNKSSNRINKIDVHKK